MKVKKNDLEFLQAFVLVSDTKSPLGDKVKLKVKDGKATFSQFSHYANLICQIDVDAESEDFETIFPIDLFVNLIQLADNNSTITVSDRGVKYGRKEVYEFESVMIEFPDEEEILTVLNGIAKKSYALKELKKLNVPKNFMGIDDLGTILLEHKSFMASDRILACIYETGNADTVKNLYFPRAIINLLGKYEIDALNIQLHDYTNGTPDDTQTILSFDLNGMKVIMPERVYSLPNLFDPDFEALYNHGTFVQVDKQIFLQKLQRMQIVASNNPNNRIFISFQEGTITLENRDYNTSNVVIPAVVSTEIIGKEVLLSCTNLIKIINFLDGEKVFLYSSQEEETLVVRIEDENHKAKFIHTTFETDEE